MALYSDSLMIERWMIILSNAVHGWKRWKEISYCFSAAPFLAASEALPSSSVKMCLRAAMMTTTATTMTTTTAVIVISTASTKSIHYLLLRDAQKREMKVAVCPPHWTQRLATSKRLRRQLLVDSAAEQHKRSHNNGLAFRQKRISALNWFTFLDTSGSWHDGVL